jgi:hypothetical protein
MSVPRLPLVADFQQKLDNSSYHNLFFNHYFTKYFKLLHRKESGYGNFNHVCNVSPIHLHTLLGVGNFTKVARVCAGRL